MSLSNTAFFHPQSTVRNGFRVENLFNPSSQQVAQGVLLGSKERRVAYLGDNPDDEIPVEAARPGSHVVWTHEGEPLETSGKFLRSASITSIRSEAGGTRHFLTRPNGDGKFLILVQTGLRGTKDDHLHQVIENATKGVLPGFHGSLALDTGALAVAEHEEALAPEQDELITVVPQVRHLRWWRPRTKLPGTPGIRARVMDLYEVSPGAELLVTDIFPGREFRLVIRNGAITAVDAPRNARDLIAEAMRKRSEVADRRRARAAETT